MVLTKFIKKAYYVIALTGLLFTFTNMTLPGFDSTSPTYSLSTLANNQQDAGESTNLATSTNKNHNAKVEDLGVVEYVKDKKGESHPVTFDPYSGLYKIRQQSYVYVEGQYLPYNSRNTYVVNGVKIKFEPKPTAIAPTQSKKSLAFNNSIKNSDFAVNPALGGAMNAQNIKNVMSSLNKAQKNIQMRDQALEELMQED